MRQEFLQINVLFCIVRVRVDTLYSKYTIYFVFCIISLDCLGSHQRQIFLAEKCFRCFCLHALNLYKVVCSDRGKQKLSQDLASRPSSGEWKNFLNLTPKSYYQVVSLLITDWRQRGKKERQKKRKVKWKKGLKDFFPPVISLVTKCDVYLVRISASMERRCKGESTLFRSCRYGRFRRGKVFKCLHKDLRLNILPWSAQ